MTQEEERAALDKVVRMPGALEVLAGEWDRFTREEKVKLAYAHPVFWAMLCGEGRWKPARHLFFLARALLRIFDGECRRLIVSMPPRHGKTAFVWRVFGSWWLGRRPRDKVMGVTYQGRQACRWSKQARDDLAKFGPEVFGVGASMRSAAEEWPVLRAGVPTEGLMNALGTEGALTGKGSNLLIGDDLVKGVKETRNPQIRQQAWEWVDQDLLTRFEDPASACVFVGTRWHDDDIIGRVLAAQARGEPPGGYEWEVINLALLALEDDALGRAPGECLWPERWTQDWAERKKRTTPVFSFSALFQGRPVPSAGGIFKKIWFRYYTVAGEYLVGQEIRVHLGSLLKFVTLDPAFSKKSSADHSALGAWGLDVANRRLFLLEVVRARLEAHELAGALKGLMSKHSATICFAEKNNLKEDQMKVIRKAVPMREIQPNTDKVARAMPATAHLASGLMLFPANAAFLPAYENELLVFRPDAAEDDQVDMTSYAVHVVNEGLLGQGGLIDVGGGPLPRLGPAGPSPMLKRPT